jgi:hypothetical protein
MVRSPTLKLLARALARLDRRLIAVGRDCCAGRSQAALHRTVSHRDKTPAR